MFIPIQYLLLDGIAFAMLLVGKKGGRGIVGNWFKGCLAKLTYACGTPRS